VTFQLLDLLLQNNSMSFGIEIRRLGVRVQTEPERTPGISTSDLHDISQISGFFINVLRFLSPLLLAYHESVSTTIALSLSNVILVR
jgi:hypothetical protein